MWIDPVIGCACRLVLALVFGAAALHKLAAPREFVAVLREYQLLPAQLVGPAAVFVICAEIFAAVGIWWVAMRLSAAAVAMALLVAYGWAIGINLWRGRREIDCGCSFGPSQQPLSPALLARNGVLLLPCAGAGLPLSGPINWAVCGASLFAAVAFGLCYQVWGVLLANRPRVFRLRGQ